MLAVESQTHHRNKRTVITGLGCITPYGLGAHVLFNGLVSGKSCLRPITKFDIKGFRSKKAGEVDPACMATMVRRQRLGRIPFLSQLGVCAASMAIDDANLRFKHLAPQEVGLFVGSEGSWNLLGRIYDTLVEKGPAEVSCLEFQEAVANAAASRISITRKVRGPCVVVAKGSHALHSALRALRFRNQSCAIVGGVDEYTRVCHEAYSSLKVSSPQDGGEEKCRPFDSRRNGVLFSEGAAFFVVETLDGALKRGARIKAEILGSAMGSDGYEASDNDPDGLGFEVTMKRALTDAGVSGKEIDWVAASARGLRIIDQAETKAIKRVFGTSAQTMPVSSIYSSLGEMRCAGGLVNIIAAIEAMRNGVILPTANYGVPDPECDLDYVPNVARKTPVKTVLINTSMWGGIYTSVVLRRPYL